MCRGHADVGTGTPQVFDGGLDRVVFVEQHGKEVVVPDSPAGCAVPPRYERELESEPLSAR